MRSAPWLLLSIKLSDRVALHIEEGEHLKVLNVITACSIALGENGHLANDSSARLLNEILERDGRAHV